MAQGKNRTKSQRPGDSLKKTHKKSAASTSKGVNKKKTEPRGGAKHNVTATTNMKRSFQKAINAKIEEEVGQRARAYESKSFSLIKPGESSTSGGKNAKSAAGLSVKATLKETSKRLQKKQGKRK